MKHRARAALVLAATIGVIVGATFGISGAMAASNRTNHERLANAAADTTTGQTTDTTTTTTGTGTSTAPGPPSPPKIVVGGKTAHLPAQLKRRLQKLRGRAVELRGDLSKLGIAGPAVHATEVVPSTSGGYETLTEDNGTLTHVSGNTLTIKESVGSHIYKTVTITVPAGATVTRGFSKASLSDLEVGDTVQVLQTSHGTNVAAMDAKSGPVPFPAAPGMAFGPVGAAKIAAPARP